MSLPDFRNLIENTIEAMAFILRHTIVAGFFILCLGALHRLLLWIGEPKLFNAVPVAWAFDAIDIGILAVLMVTVCIEALRVFCKRSDRQ